MAIRIVTDSSADLAPALAQANDITVIPCYVIIGSETYKDGVEITADRFYSRLEGLSRLPTTAQPSVADFQEVYQRLLDQGHQIVSVHISSKLSGTLNSASQAKASLGDSRGYRNRGLAAGLGSDGPCGPERGPVGQGVNRLHGSGTQGAPVPSEESRFRDDEHPGVPPEGRGASGGPRPFWGVCSRSSRF